MRLHSTKRVLVLGAIAVGAFTLGAATMVVAGGDTVVGQGSFVNRVKTAASSTSFEATNPSNVDLPGARHRLVLTRASTLVVARFVATINCFGDPGRCHAQVVVLDNNNGDALVTTMNGVNHLDSTFTGEGHESHPVEASITLPPGDYDFQVQLSTFFCCDGATDSITVHIPMWHFTVERIIG
jgi:hypothetical protein